MKRTRSNEKGIPYGSREHMPLWYPLAWSSRGISAALNVVLIGYITYYCTDLLGLNAVTVGIILMLTKVVDAVTDVFAGFIIDHTHTRFGKARPYEIFIILLWVFTVLMFNVPDGSAVMQYAWVAIMYIIVNAVCTTMLGAADSVYMARVFTTEKNRIQAISVNGVVVMFVCIVFNIIMPQLVGGLGATKGGWVQISLIMGIPLSIIGILRFILCREVETETPAETPAASQNNTKQTLSLKETLRTLFLNKYALIVIALMFFNNIITNLSVVTTYYFKYIMGSIELQSIASMTSLITPIVLMLFPLMTRKLGTTKLLRYGMICGIIGMIIRTLGGANLVTIIIGGLFFGLATLPISMMINTYLIDCMDYGEWKNGVRVEGMIASISNFAGKLGGAAATGLTGLLMGLAGYNGNLAQQSASATNMIIIVYNILPLIVFIIMLILAYMYKMDSIRDEMKNELAQRHQN